MAEVGGRGSAGRGEERGSNDDGWHLLGARFKTHRSQEGRELRQSDQVYQGDLKQRRLGWGGPEVDGDGGPRADVDIGAGRRPSSDESAATVTTAVSGEHTSDREGRDAAGGGIRRS